MSSGSILTKATFLGFLIFGTSIAYATDEQTMEKSLRPRTHHLSWEYQTVVTEVQNVRVSTGAAAFGYGRNFGRFELSISLASTLAESGSAKNTSNALAAGGVINFIENKPGNDFIPGVQISLLSSSADTNGTETTGTGVGFAAGFKWYPFSELFAVAGSLNTATLNMKSGSTTADAKIAGLSLGWLISF